MARRPAANAIVPDPKKSVGLRSDSDWWGALVLFVGSLALRLLTYFQHIEFLANVKEGGFKKLFDLWDGFGWFAILAIGFIWGFNRFSKRTLPHEKGPTWGLVIACSVIAAIFGSLVTVQSSTRLPTVASEVGIMVDQKSLTAHGCRSQINGNVLMAFQHSFKVAFVCGMIDPKIDILSDPHIFVSNLFEIVPALIPVEANASPSGPFSVSTGNAFPMQFFVILVPRETKWEKLTTLSDVESIGGKIPDPRYY